MPDLKLLADLSHYVVGRELPGPGSVEDDEQIRTILRHSWSFHGRIASSEQVQVGRPGFPQHQPWVEQFTGWWRYGIEHWLGRADGPQACPSLASWARHPMRLPTHRARTLTDRWAEALKLSPDSPGVGQLPSMIC